MIFSKTILLLDNDDDSLKAESLLKQNNLPFEILPKDATWEEIEWPIPTLFYKDKKIYKGLEEIRGAIHELSRPN